MRTGVEIARNAELWRNVEFAKADARVSRRATWATIIGNESISFEPAERSDRVAVRKRSVRTKEPPVSRI